MIRADFCGHVGEGNRAEQEVMALVNMYFHRLYLRLMREMRVQSGGRRESSHTASDGGVQDDSKGQEEEKKDKEEEQVGEVEKGIMV